MPEGKEVKQSAHEPGPIAGAKRSTRNKLLVIVPLILLLLLGVGAGVVYGASPAAVRQPKMDHYHFRMQLVVSGKDVDFGAAPFQTAYAKDQCSGEITNEPIHFHDQKPQFVHIHWQNMTGGLVLKNYGWNFIGGMDSVLGYRFDNLPGIKKVPIHGQSLPGLPNNAQFWVYTGDEDSYKKRAFDDFKRQDLEQFFGRQSNFLTYEPGSRGVLDWLFPTVAAHGGHDHAAAPAETEQQDADITLDAEQERLTRINNLLGNVVIFVQAEEPSDQAIKDKFAHLEPLSDSTCGG